MDKLIKIKFKGEDYVFVGDSELMNGAIATKEDFESFNPSYAHLYEDGVVRRFGNPIGTKEDIKVLEEIEND